VPQAPTTAIANRSRCRNATFAMATAARTNVAVPSASIPDRDTETPSVLATTQGRNAPTTVRPAPASTTARITARRSASSMTGRWTPSYLGVAGGAVPDSPERFRAHETATVSESAQGCRSRKHPRTSFPEAPKDIVPGSAQGRRSRKRSRTFFKPCHNKTHMALESRQSGGPDDRPRQSPAGFGFFFSARLGR